MRNMEIAAVLEETADFLDMEDVAYKPRAYREAAQRIARLEDPIEDVHAEDRLEEVPGIGESIAKDIQAFLKTGESPRLAELKQATPVNLQALTRVTLLGPKRVKHLHDALGIQNLKDLEQAARAGKIQEVPGFGEKTQQAILDALYRTNQEGSRTLLANAKPLVEDLVETLEAESAFDTVTPVGSYRRQRATIGDVDLVALTNDANAAIDAFVTLDNVDTILTQGTTQSNIRLTNGLQVDLILANKPAYGAAMVHFTGSKDHNIELRKRARTRGLKLNEHGLFDGNHRIAGATEDDIYHALDLPWIPPELREATNETQTARNEGPPPLIQPHHLKGDLQMHTTESDGRHTLQQMANKAHALGHEYILVTDHGPASPASGPNPDPHRIKQHTQSVNDTVDTTVLAGIEANIQPDGSLDLPNEALEPLDLVVASHHHASPNATEAITTAIENHPLDILGHPTNRRIGKREPNPLDYARIAQACNRNNVAIEINSQPDRLDPPWRRIKDHLRGQAPLVISTDAHSTHDLENLDLGVAQARRAWLTPDDILNTLPLTELLETLRPESPP